MNQKQCKKLRQQARGYTLGKPWVDYMAPRILSKPVQMPVPGKLEPELQVFRYAGTVRLHPMCGRAQYKALKREAA
jgi:hypothetical protein